MDKNIKVGVISDLIATFVFIYFLNPILNFISNILVRFLSVVYSSYVDRLYSEIALGFVTDPNIYITLFLVVILIITIVAISLIRMDFGNFLKRITIISWILVYLVILTGTSTCIFKYKLNKSFQIHIKLLGPSLTNDMEKQLWHDWVKISSKKDYDEVYCNLNDIATKAGIKLSELPVTIPF